MKDIREHLLIVIAAAVIFFQTAVFGGDSNSENRIEVPPLSSKQILVVGFKTGFLLAGKTEDSVGAEYRDAALAGIDHFRTAGFEVRPLFTRSAEELRVEREAAVSKTGTAAPDLTRWFLFKIPREMSVRDAIDYLSAMREVDTVYPLPRAVPASAGAPPAPDYFLRQGYLGPAPGGLEVQYAWTLAGGKGEKVKIADIEGDWNVKHKDLKKIKGRNIDGYRNKTSVWTEHGTAVLGILAGSENSIGVTGIAHKSKVLMFSIFRNASGNVYHNVPDAISRATRELSRGDVILLEVQYSGLQNNGDYIPVEYYDADFEAIQAAVAKGIIVVEAAGNGGQNLDSAMYDNRFDTKVRGDSGAIMVGAGAPPANTLLSPPYLKDRSRIYFSNYGARVDVQNWGQYVTSTGYGDLYSGQGANYYFTGTFNGTSSASALTAGAVAVLASISERQQKKTLASSEMRTLLISTGSPQKGNKSQHIGPRPDLKKAVNELLGKAPVNDE